MGSIIPELEGLSRTFGILDQSVVLLFLDLFQEVVGVTLNQEGLVLCGIVTILRETNPIGYGVHGLQDIRGGECRITQHYLWIAFVQHFIIGQACITFGHYLHFRTFFCLRWSHYTRLPKSCQGLSEYLTKLGDYYHSLGGTACGTGSLSTNRTDFLGQELLEAGLSLDNSRFGFGLFGLCLLSLDCLGQFGDGCLGDLEGLASGSQLGSHGLELESGCRHLDILSGFVYDGAILTGLAELSRTFWIVDRNGRVLWGALTTTVVVV